ncbi:MAG: methylenetetrahydrofolate reductase [Chitinophagaceae bacterium]|nr:methylenetetrahydrofolate reductase [Chitinophagaceae bacterium]
MKVTEHLKKAEPGKPIISFEILPPVKGKSIESIYKSLDPLMEFNPSFINVTYHRSEQTFRKQSDGSFQRVEIRKRPGTVGICAALMHHYNIDAVPHLICGGFSKDETENALIDLNYLGINNVLALRGDPPKNEKYFQAQKDGHNYAIDLVKQIDDLNKGIYIEEDLNNAVKTDFCIGVAGYPEKHHESPNPLMDLMYLKNKIEAGASYITTQMFFDNKKFEHFLNQLKAENINCPVIPGLKPITNKKQLSILPSIFNVEIPSDLAKALMSCKNEEAEEQVGTEWLIQQSKELIKLGTPALHYYTLGKPHVIYNVVKALL